MADTPTLRLRDDSREPVDSYLFDRRGELRRAASGQVTVLLRKVDEAGAHYRIASMTLMDISPAGMGGICHDPLDPDSSVAVLFPPHGPEHGFDAAGHVVRCRRLTQGYEIGIRFHGRQAA